MWFTEVNVPTAGGNIGLVLDVVDSTRGPMISQDGKRQEAESVLFKEKWERYDNK